VKYLHSDARVHGIKTIAEYVHKPVIAEILKEMGVDYTQGFALHEPEPFEPPSA